MYVNALNYDSTATIDDGSCCFVVGCLDAAALNYDPNACIDDGSCTYPAIGDAYGGGIIFYILQPGDLRYSAGHFHGLIAATSDQSLNITWGCSTNTGADGTAIGTGSQNTSVIVSSFFCEDWDPPQAADFCANLTFGGYSDWFLPSKDEINKMYLNIGQGNALGLGNVAGFAND